LVNGSTLYVLDRHTGRPVDQWQVGGAPGAAPAVTDRHVIVPLVSGRIEAYPLDGEKSSPWFYQSSGRSLVAPLATSRSIVWSTDQGNLYFASAGIPKVRFRFETPSEFLAEPAYRENMVFAISQVGELYAVDEKTGSRRWKYATGYPTDRAPAVVGDVIFVTSEQPALHCVDAKSGHGIWEAEDVAQFAAASDQRVYGVDRYGTLLVLDRATGAEIGRLPTTGEFQALVNDQTDRLYLLSENGIVQCLHEVGRREPIFHNAPPAAPAAPPEQPPAEPAASEDRSTEPEPAPPSAPPEAAPTEPAAAEPFGGVETPSQPEPETPSGEEADPFAF
jgi:outer membrane protein assembly factor BamB